MMCSVRWDWFGFLLVIDFAVITGSSVPPILGGVDINYLLTVLSPVPGELALTAWWAPKALTLFANFILHCDNLVFVPLFRGSFDLSSCSPITLLSFSALNDRAVREWLMSRGWIERCNLGGSSPISREFSAAKSPAGINDFAVPMDQTPALTAEGC